MPQSNPLHVEFGDPENDDIALNDSPESKQRRPCCLCCFYRRWHCIVFFLTIFGALGFVLYPREVVVAFKESEWFNMLHKDNNDFYFKRDPVDITESKFVFDTNIPLEIGNENFIPLRTDLKIDIYYPPSKTDGYMIGTAAAKVRVPPFKTVVEWSEVSTFSMTPVETVAVGSSLAGDCLGKCLNPFQECTDAATFFMDVKVVPRYVSEDLWDKIVGPVRIGVEVPIACDIVYQSGSEDD
ncbi:hypothetical protein TrRE_jg10143 [Triparma retinervis]|uniref:Uncharacterized protein n=1 Tax=Triparma retinervis TaxID=2557542 RepID=A0A9W7L5U7_9STRA|nr:hypothetical protein TrRE_jg10143 [Triparma retinervis]